MNTKTAKAPKSPKKAPKPHSLFRKAIPKALFTKRILGLIEQEKDKAFLLSSFAEGELSYTLKPGLSAAELKRLSKLAAAIKANRGILKAGPLIGIILLVSGIALFALFFMNPLVESAAQSALQGLFSAKVEIAQLRFEPWRSRLSLSSLKIADKDSPMQNLIDTGRIELRLNTAALLRGRLYIEEASAASLAFGTARASSGALSGAAPATEPTAAEDSLKKDAAPPMIDLGKFDAQALLERERDKLASTAAYAAAGEAYAEASNRWKGRVDSSSAALTSLRTSSQRALAIDPRNIKTIAAATSAISDVQQALGAAKTTAAEASSIYGDIRRDAESLTSLALDAKKAFDTDFAYLRSLVDPKSGAALAMLEPSIRQILSERAQVYLHYGLRALEVASRLKASAPQKEGGPKKKPLLAKGRDVSYPGQRYPRFRLGLLSSDFSLGGDHWKIELKEWSSEPQLVQDPTSISVVYTSASGMGIEAQAQAQLGSELAQDQSYQVRAQGRGIAFDLADAFASAGLGGFSANLDAQLGLTGNQAGSVQLELGMKMLDPKVARAEGNFGKAIASALVKNKGLKADIAYSKSPASKEKFSLKTDIDKLVQAAIAEILSNYTKQALAELDRAMKRYLAEELSPQLGSKAELDALLERARSGNLETEGIRSNLEGKLKELEAKAKTLGASVLPGIKLPGL